VERLQTDELAADDIFEDAFSAYDYESNFFEAIDEPVALEVVVAQSFETGRNASLSALSAFQRSAERFPPLNPEEQLEMARVYRDAVAARLSLAVPTRRGKKEQARLEELARWETRAMEHLCASCWKLAWLIVREQAEERFGRDRAVDMLPDLMSEANGALVQAVREFDPARTPKFGTYAARVIRDHTRAVLAKDGYMRLAPSWGRVKRIVSARMPELVSELGRHPTTAELQADLLRRCLEWANQRLTDEQRLLPEPQVRSLCMAKLRKQGMLGAIRDVEDVLQATQQVASLDQRIGSSDSTATLGDMIAHQSADSMFDSAELDELRQALMAEMMSALTERERTIVLLRYGFDGSEQWTYTALADRFEVTPERIRQIERAALAKLAAPGGGAGRLGVFLPQFEE